MKIYIMTNMEGISGVRRQADCVQGSAHYEECRSFMAGDINAAIAGAFEGGIDTIGCVDHSAPAPRRGARGSNAQHGSRGKSV